MPIDHNQFDKDSRIGELTSESSSDISAQISIAQRRTQKPFLRLHWRGWSFVGLTATSLVFIIVSLVAFPNELQREALSLRWNHKFDEKGERTLLWNTAEWSASKAIPDMSSALAFGANNRLLAIGPHIWH